MNQNDGESMRTNSGSEQTSFGNQPNSSFESGSAGADSSVGNSVKNKASNLPSMLADGLQAGAEALRQRRPVIAVKEGVEKQVKEHPARTLLVALGAGFLLWKALRR